MFTYLRKTINKKGFTLVETIIVVAIIGIMAAVLVPNFTASQRRGEATKANEHARAFYFAVQNTILAAMENDNTEKEFRLELPAAGSGSFKNRITPTPASPEAIVNFTNPSHTYSNHRFFIYAELNDSGQIENAEFSFLTPSAYIATATPATIATYDPAVPRTSLSGVNDVVFHDLMVQIDGYLASEGHVGYYYAMFDSQFRVVMAYYSKFVDRTTARSVGYQVKAAEGNNSIANRIYGAFPRQYAFSGDFRVEVNGVMVLFNSGGTPQWFINNPTEVSGTRRLQDVI